MIVVVNITDGDAVVKSDFIKQWIRKSHNLTTNAPWVYDRSTMINNMVVQTTTKDIIGPIVRSISYDITDPKPGQKISGFLKEKGYSEQNLVNLKKDPYSIQVNGSYEHQNYVLKKGDCLTVQIREQDSSDGILPVKLPFTIVYEDEELFVIDKPAGMPIHPSRNNPDNSLGNALTWYMKEKGIPFVFRCINRLD
ncbi:MAG: hypothetical protein PUG54_05085, partial [Firmicutes bacterium]|nr:hypothetical protein [Bacillota bacterium]